MVADRCCAAPSPGGRGPGVRASFLHTGANMRPPEARTFPAHAEVSIPPDPPAQLSTFKFKFSGANAGMQDFSKVRCQRGIPRYDLRRRRNLRRFSISSPEVQVRV